jgi:hypothetical protein
VHHYKNKYELNQADAFGDGAFETNIQTLTRATTYVLSKFAPFDPSSKMTHAKPILCMYCECQKSCEFFGTKVKMLLYPQHMLSLSVAIAMNLKNIIHVDNRL